MNAIGYIRVSTEEQANEGVSLDSQAEKVKAFCVAKDWKLVKIVQDAGKSAKDLNRPGIQKIISGCKSRDFDVIVVTKLDRLTRNVRDLGYLIQDVFEKTGVGFSSISDNFDTTTANGKLVLNILGSVAQWERDIIAERTRDALQYKKQKGEHYSPAPLGFDAVDGQLIPNEKELQTVDYIRSLKAKKFSLRKIADTLNSEGVATKNGGRWFHNTIKHILSNTIYQNECCSV